MVAKLLSEIIELFDGLRCDRVFVGEGTGSHLSLNFSAPDGKNRIVEPRDFSIFLQECCWRISNRNEILCCSQSSNKNDGRMATFAKKLEGHVVSSISLESPSFDINVFFENGLSLKTFNFHHTVEEFDNFSIFSPSQVITIDSKGAVVFEKRVVGH